MRQKGIFARHDLPLDYDDLEDIAILAGALRKQDVGTSKPACAPRSCLAASACKSACRRPCQTGTASLTIRRPGNVGLPTLKHRQSLQNDTLEQDGKHRKETEQNVRMRKCWRSTMKVTSKASLKGVRPQSADDAALCGATGSGKTTMGKTLMSAIPPGERLITIEDTLELVISHENHVRLLYSKSGIGLGGVTAEELLQASLRMRPDRILLG